MPSKYTTHYALLGLDDYTSRTAIKKRRRDLTKTLHPDLNPGDPTGPVRLAEINAATDVLLDEPAEQERVEHRRANGRDEQGRFAPTAMVRVEPDTEPDAAAPAAAAEADMAAAAEAQRVAAAAAEAEAERERVATAEAERERVAAAEAERERVTAAAAEAERVAAAEAERERVAAAAAEAERERVAAAAAAAEAERVARSEAMLATARKWAAAESERHAAERKRAADAERSRKAALVAGGVGVVGLVLIALGTMNRRDRNGHLHDRDTGEYTNSRW